MNIAITGTTRGIGGVLAERLSAEYNVIELNRPRYQLNELESLSLVDFSNIDVLILNAGVTDKKILVSEFEHQPVSDWKYIIDTNLIGNIFLIQQYLKQRQSGTIVYVSGAAVTRRKEGSVTTMHALSKKAMSAFVEDLRYELQHLKKHIRLVDVKPGLTKSSKNDIDSSGRIPTTYNEVADGIIFALKHPSILNIDFEKHEKTV